VPVPTNRTLLFACLCRLLLLASYSVAKQNLDPRKGGGAATLPTVGRNFDLLLPLSLLCCVESREVLLHVPRPLEPLPELVPRAGGDVGARRGRLGDGGSFESQAARDGGGGMLGEQEKNSFYLKFACGHWRCLPHNMSRSEGYICCNQQLVVGFHDRSANAEAKASPSPPHPNFMAEETYTDIPFMNRRRDTQNCRLQQQYMYWAKPEEKHIMYIVLSMCISIAQLALPPHALGTPC